MKTTGIITTSLAIIVLSPIWRGFVFSKLWLWFVCASFGLPEIGIAQAVGLAVMVSLLTYQNGNDDESKDPTGKLAKAFGVAFFYPAIVMLIGCVAKSFM